MTLAVDGSAPSSSRPSASCSRTRLEAGNLALRAAQLNVAELARDADVAPNTAKSWLAILEASGVVSLLQPWHTNLSKRLVKTPKLHSLDTGLAA